MPNDLTVKVSRKLTLTSASTDPVGRHLTLGTCKVIRINDDRDYRTVAQRGDGIEVIPYREGGVTWHMVPPKSVQRRAFVIPWEDIQSLHLY